jgi:hypothetical protein
MAIYLCRCPQLGIGFLETLATHRKTKGTNLVKSVKRGIADAANLFAQVDGR